MSKKRPRMIEVEVTGRHYRPFIGKWHAEGNVHFDTSAVPFVAEKEGERWLIDFEVPKNYDKTLQEEALRLIEEALDGQKRFVSLDLRLRKKRKTRRILTKERVEQKIHLAHGGGGTLMFALINDLFVPAFGEKNLARLEDTATIRAQKTHIVFTSDSYVIRPIFFPGGDIGRLAVSGTLNDLATAGAKPIALSFSLILEEGFSVPDLNRIVRSAAATAAEAAVPIVTGDTKVVEKGAADSIFINTAGIGIPHPDARLSISNAKPGDSVIITGTVGDHGIAVMSRRKGLAFDIKVESDVAPLSRLAVALLDRFGRRIHTIKDPTRGGLASALNEIAEASNVEIIVEEDAIPIKIEVQAACEMLGLDPLVVANEGKLILVVSNRVAEEVVRYLRRRREGRNAAVIGRVVEGVPRVVLRTSIGGARIVDMPYGEQLPRIC